MARYRVDVFRTRFTVVDLQNDVKDARQLNEPRSTIHPLFHPMFAVTLPAFVLRLSRASLCLRHRRFELVNAPSAAISIAHFSLDGDSRLFARTVSMD